LIDNNITIARAKRLVMSPLKGSDANEGQRPDIRLTRPLKVQGIEEFGDCILRWQPTFKRQAADATVDRLSSRAG
jgi:hypothetical protein